MKKTLKTVIALMLTTAMFFAVGCGKDDDPNNGGEGSTPVEEGIYLGIIGFNYNLYPKEIGLLNNSTKGSFTSFINDLTMDNLTGLYFADYTALNKLQSYGEPPKLTNVALVTFIDGLDNASLDDDKNPENYPTREAYLNALNNKIKTEKVHGLNINAYTIGLKGNDVQDVAAFQNNLKKLASSDDKVFEVTSMDEAIQHFAEIAESLHSISTSTSLSLLVPPGYDDGLVLRFTFDQVGSATNSSLFIECTYKRSDNGRRLENITYHGFKQGVTSLSSVEKLSNGFYKFVFENLEKENGGFITQSDKEHLKLYRQFFSGWEPETEFDNNSQSTVTEEQRSALIMLVLDCTTSLGNQFSSLKTGAVNFVETLVSSNGGGNNGGGNGGGGNGGGTSDNTPTVTTDIIADITTNSAKGGGTVTDDGGSSVTERGICWSTSHEPTINNNYVKCGSGTGFFVGEMMDLLENTIYYVRAYATNSVGTSYGEELPFQTEESNIICNVNVYASPVGLGEVTGGGVYLSGELCTVTASGHNGYSFFNWTENGSVVSLEESYSFIVTGDRSLIANFDHACVDLGLPSGTLWATCNVGATTPEGYGDYYFAWGETNPKDTYYWSTYKYCNGDVDQLTKYCNNSNDGYNGFTDNLTVLQPGDDAATANWGDGWCMPTKAQWEELYQNTPHTWATQNGVKGWLFTATNGNRLFLPASGFYLFNEIYSVGSYGYYWSSSLDTNDPNDAWSFYFFFLSNDYGMGSYYRCEGQSVRPVRSAR